eukprot:Platyproteum_vivax@DN1412_c0_g1_i1.p1
MGDTTEEVEKKLEEQRSKELAEVVEAEVLAHQGEELYAMPQNVEPSEIVEELQAVTQEITPKHSEAKAAEGEEEFQAMPAAEEFQAVPAAEEFQAMPQAMPAAEEFKDEEEAKVPLVIEESEVNATSHLDEDPAQIIKKEMVVRPEAITLEETQTENPPTESLPVRQYLNLTVVPVLLPALNAVVKERPADPVTFVAHYMLKHQGSKA